MNFFHVLKYPSTDGIMNSNNLLKGCSLWLAGMIFYEN
nr:MAG TPA: hypothetical protein [Caudoviricetes sp.]DAR59679.1 MAG TPA: hypothetical protein [Caudoviricetes sp.]DAT61877.1 MAG TPA: hypothetical protein [Caudoviricetes sp.]